MKMQPFTRGDKRHFHGGPPWKKKSIPTIEMCCTPCRPPNRKIHQITRKLLDSMCGHIDNQIHF